MASFEANLEKPFQLRIAGVRRKYQAKRRWRLRDTFGILQAFRRKTALSKDLLNLSEPVRKQVYHLYSWPFGKLVLVVFHRL